jgi:hypothetical protein
MSGDDTLFFDGTFRVVFQGLKQLVILHWKSKNKKKSIPIAFGFLVK